jgi:hypothetical protein
VYAAVEGLRSSRAEPHDRRVGEITRAQLVVPGARRIDAVTHELDAVDGEAPPGSSVRGEDHAVAVSKRPRLVAHLHRDRRAAPWLDGHDPDGLKIAAAVAGRPNVPRTEMLLDVRRGKVEAPSEIAAALELVRRQIRHPGLQVFEPDIRDAGRGGNAVEDEESERTDERGRPVPGGRQRGEYPQRRTRGRAQAKLLL